MDNTNQSGIPVKCYRDKEVNHPNIFEHKDSNKLT